MHIQSTLPQNSDKIWFQSTVSKREKERQMPVKECVETDQTKKEEERMKERVKERMERQKRIGNKEDKSR